MIFHSYSLVVERGELENNTFLIGKPVNHHKSFMNGPCSSMFKITEGNGYASASKPRSGFVWKDMVPNKSNGTSLSSRETPHFHTQLSWIKLIGWYIPSLYPHKPMIVLIAIYISKVGWIIYISHQLSLVVHSIINCCFFGGGYPPATYVELTNHKK